MKSLIEIINLVVNLTLLDKLTKIIFNGFNSVMEFLGDFFNRNNFVSFNVLLQCFQSDVSENLHFFMLAEVNVIF